MSFKAQFSRKESFKGDFFPVVVSDVDIQEGDIIDEEENEEEDGNVCGIGSFKPEWLQKFKKPKVLFINHSILAIIQGAFFAYFIGCLSTLEKRYAYDAKVSGFIMIADEISPIFFSLLLGYFGGKAHRPRVIALGMFTTAFSCFIMSFPYFIYGPALHFSSKTDLLSEKKKVELCDGTTEDLSCEQSATMTAVSLFFFANFLKGFGSLTFVVIGSSYLDDSIKKKNTPAYFGALFSLRLLGPTLGFFLSSLCLQYYEDPFYDPGYNSGDPRWIGAWWLGFIVLGIALFIFSVPMMLFPRQLTGRQLPESKKTMKGDYIKTTLLTQLKDMGKALKRLGQNPILICHYLGGVLQVNGIMGYYFLLPKYVEMQFQQSASKASLYAGPASLISMQIGVFLGGLVIRKFQPRPRILTGSIIFFESFSWIFLICCMFITCPSYQLTGTSVLENHRLNLQNECNVNCTCSTSVFTPVCGPDGRSTYFSPCFAGCSSLNKTGDLDVFTDCKCVHDDVGELIIGNAERGYCDTGCQLLVAFIVILSVGKLLSAVTSVGNVLVTLRCVDPEDKSIALGALSGVFSLLASVPYPLIYGALTDASCLVWEGGCDKKGNCWIYDTDKFRFLLHGVSVAFVFLGWFVEIFVCILSPRMKHLYDEDNKKETLNAEAKVGVKTTSNDLDVEMTNVKEEVSIKNQ